MVLAPQLLALFGYHGALGVNLARIMFPTVVLLGLNGLQSAILNALDEFFLPAIAPVFWNIVIVGTLALSLPFLHTMDKRIYAYAVGILLGTVVQLAIPYPAMRRLGRLAWYCDPRDEAVRRVFALMLPVTLGLGLINLNVLVDTWFATSVNHDIGPAAIDKAFRIYMLPQGMFSVAVAAVLFPALSRRAAARDGPGFRDLAGAGLRQIAFLLVPAAALCAVLATPMVRLLYEHGNFTPARHGRRRPCLAAFSRGLAFNGVMLLLNRAFFSMQMAWVPTSIAVAKLIVNGVLDWVFTRAARRVGHPARDLDREHRRRRAALHAAAPARGPARRARARARARAIAVASALAVGAGWGVWRGLDALLGQFVVYQLAHARRRPGRSGRALRAGRAGHAHRGARRRARARSGAAAARRPRPEARRASTRAAESSCPAKIGRWSSPASVTSRSSRTSTTASRRSPIASWSSAGRLRARDARADARLDGSRARARHHDQGPGRARALDVRGRDLRAQPDRHARARRLHLRGLALAGRLRGRDARRRRGAGPRGADARERAPRDRERPRDRAGAEQDRPARRRPRRASAAGRRLPRRQRRRRAAHLGQDRRRRRRRARRRVRAHPAARRATSTRPRARSCSTRPTTSTAA